MLVNAVGYLAEAAYHHPDLTVTWGRITVKLQNHAAGGITDKDFELARKIEEVVLWRPTGRRARGHAEQVGAAGGSAIGGRADGRTDGQWIRKGRPAPAVLFVTGRLAEPALRRVLAEMRAAVRGGGRGAQDHGRRADDDAVDRPLPRGARRHGPGAAFPGSARATPASCSERLGVRVEKGPKDLREIPRLLRPGGRRRATTARTTSRSSPRSTTRRSCRASTIRAAAEYFRRAAPT